MKNIKKKVNKKNIKDLFSLEKIVFRFISAILAFNLSNSLNIGLGNMLSYGQDFKFVTILMIFIIVMGTLSLINWILEDTETDFYACIILLLCCSQKWLRYEGIGISFVVLLFLIFMLIFQFKKTKTNYNKKIKILIPVIAIVSCIQLYVIAKYGVLKYKMFISPNFDLGIPMQNFYYMAKTWIPYSTCERNMLISHFAVHASFIYYLVMPIYKLFTNEYTLPIVSSIIVVSGIIPTYLIAKNHNLKDSIKLLICLTYLLYAPIICGTFYDFHENLFLLPLLLWLFYFYEKKQKLGFIIFAILVFFVKEDAPIYVIIFGIYMYFDGRKKEGIATSLGALGYFMLIVLLLKLFGEGAMTDRYNNLIYQDAGMLGIIKTFIVNPGYFIKQLVTGPGKIKYYIQLLLPLGFIPLFCKDKKNYILLATMLLTTMTTYEYSFEITFHYSFGVIAFLIYLFILNIENVKNKDYLIITFIGAILINMAYVLPSVDSMFGGYKNQKKYYEEKEDFLKKIPQDASVSASAFLVPHLANRDIIYETYYHENKTDIEYVVVENTSDENKAVIEAYKKNNYKEIDSYKEIIVLKKSE